MTLPVFDDAPVPGDAVARFRAGTLAVVLLYHLPRSHQFLRHHAGAELHDPVFALPGLPPAAVYLAGALALVGLAGRLPRLACATLGAFLLYVPWLDRLYYSNQQYFCATLLLLLSLTPARARDPIPRWQQELILWQFAATFFYAALDKLLSPAWATGGQRLVALAHHELARWPGPLDGCVRAFGDALLAAPGLASALVVVAELTVAALLLWPRARRLAAPVLILTGALFEATVQPGAFGWHVALGALLCGDRSTRPAALLLACAVAYLACPWPPARELVLWLTTGVAVTCAAACAWPRAARGGTADPASSR